MLKRNLIKIQKPETLTLVWGLGLPIFLIIVAFLSRPLGVSMVTSLRDEDLANPSILALFWGGIIANIPILWLIVQLVSKAITRQAEESKQTPASFMDVMKLTESRTAPLWTVSAIGLMVIILLDTFALIIGTEPESLVLNLDQMVNASTATWLGAIIFFALILPVVEELLFRGLLYPVLVQRFQDNLQAIAVTTIVFIAYYFMQVSASDLDWRTLYVGIIFPLILGLTTGAIRAHTQSTMGAIGAHIAFNLFLLLKVVLIFG